MRKTTLIIALCASSTAHAMVLGRTKFNPRQCAALYQQLRTNWMGHQYEFVRPPAGKQDQPDQSQNRGFTIEGVTQPMHRFLVSHPKIGDKILCVLYYNPEEWIYMSALAKKRRDPSERIQHIRKAIYDDNFVFIPGAFERHPVGKQAREEHLLVAGLKDENAAQSVALQLEEILSPSRRE